MCRSKRYVGISILKSRKTNIEVIEIIQAVQNRMI